MEQLSPFRSAGVLELDDLTLQHLIVLVARYIEMWGRNPAPADIKQMILRP